jgi:hypothetical protein
MRAVSRFVGLAESGKVFPLEEMRMIRTNRIKRCTVETPLPFQEELSAVSGRLKKTQ